MNQPLPLYPNAASYRSPKAEIKTSTTAGRGLFAKQPIAKGEVISVRGGHILTRQAETELAKPPGYWGYPITDDFVLAPFTENEVEDVMMFLNHSCDPNVGILGQIVFVAKRAIAAGEELTIDYAMFGANPDPMPCNCRSPQCRALITSTDWRIPLLQTRYKGYFSSYIQRKIDQAAAPSS